MSKFIMVAAMLGGLALASIPQNAEAHWRRRGGWGGYYGPGGVSFYYGNGGWGRGRWNRGWNRGWGGYGGYYGGYYGSPYGYSYYSW